MKNLGIFYLIILIPIVSIYFIDNSVLISLVLILYVFVYRPLVDYFRLKQLKIVDNFTFKFFMPFYSLNWFKSLYFG